MPTTQRNLFPHHNHSEQPATVFALVNTASTARSQANSMEHDHGHALICTLYSDQLATVFALVYTTSTARSHATAWNMVINMPP